jgi:23S rRNA (guanosine2251-2'-O)-methyltransferase
VKNFRPKPRPKKNTLITGKNAVRTAVLEGTALDRIYVQSNGYKDMQEEMRKLANQYHIPLNYVPLEKLNSFNAGEHDGCIAVISKVRYYDLQEVISWVTERGEAPLFLILDGITDIRNIGGIARSAFALGVHAIIIPDKGVGALNEDAVLTSAGALEKIPVCRVSSLLKAIDELHLNGIQVFASEMTAKKTISEIDFKQPSAIIMGSEEKGIYPALLKSADESFNIPMPGEFESLNVSVATGIILYEASRQRSLP